jgi:hypothetical protein
MARRVLGVALVAAGAAAVLGLTLVAGPALAAARGTSAPAVAAGDAQAVLLTDTSPTGIDDERSGPRQDRLVLRLQLACDRIPNLLRRTGNLEQRLAGDAETRGSLAWLEARIAAAEAAGRSDRAQALRARLTVREDLQELLPGRVERLEQARSGICVDVTAATAAGTT